MEVKKDKTKVSLAEAFPEIAKEWHPTKNGELTPEMVTAGSGKKVWWKCEHGHEWQARVANRTNGSGCPYCIGKKVLPGFNDLATTHPELVKEWHPSKNGTLTPEMISAGSGKKVWWQCEYGHEWQSAICDRTVGCGCPYCSGRCPIPGVTDLATTHPDIAKEWHPTKNGTLIAEMFTPGSGKKIWWKCSKGHEWEAKIDNRTKGRNCPYCSKSGTSIPEQILLFYAQKHIDPEALHRFRGHGKEADVYSLKYKFIIEYDGYHHLNKEEDKAKNKFFFLLGFKPYRIREDILPELNDDISTDYYYKSGDYKKLSEYISTLIFAITGKTITINIDADFAEINDFIKHAEIEESLAKHNPELATEWHSIKNGKLTPQMVTAGSGKKVWWQCSKGHEWQATISDRAKGKGCPYCAGKKVWVGFNDLATIHPEIASEWHPTQNGSLTPDKITSNSGKKIWWKCERGHEWQAYIYSRTGKEKTGCPYCSGRLPISGTTDLATTHPDIAAEWNYAMNGDLTPEMVSAGSGKNVWWKCSHCGHEYQRRINNQTNKDSTHRCPKCKTPVASSSDSDKIPS